MASGFSFSMKLEHIFDILLTERKIALVMSRKQSESLRVSLLRKFKDYKQQMIALGFFDDSMEDLVVSCEWVEPATAKMFLRPRKRVDVEYTIIVDDGVSDANANQA